MMACGRRGGVRGLDPSPGLGHGVVFLGKTLYYCSGSLYPGANKLNAGGKENYQVKVSFFCKTLWALNSVHLTSLFSCVS